MGETQRSIIDQCIKQGLPLPEKIQNAPEIHWGLEIFYVAFIDLCSCRMGGGMSEGPIIWTAIIDWCNENDVYGEQREDVIYHITHLDAAYLDAMNKKRKAMMPKGKGTGGGKGVQRARK